MAIHSIGGEWRGHYKYDDLPKLGSDFTAFFSESSGEIWGSIVDDSAEGKASLSGSFSFPSVQFTKVYSKAGESKKVEKSKRTVPKGSVKLFGFLEIRIEQEQQITETTTQTWGDPVEYEGSMSEDGKTLSGTWKVSGAKGTSKGTWTANRLEEEEETKAVEEKVSRLKQEELEEQLP